MVQVENDKFMQTHTRKKFDFLNPKPDMVDVEDIAWALAHTCRFGGHCDRFYSVAEHSFRLSLSPERGSVQDALTLLFHDAAEAYVGDVPRPLKHLLGPEFSNIEARILKVIAEKEGFEYPLPLWVKELDARALKTERDLLMKSDIPWTVDGLEPLSGWSDEIGWRFGVEPKRAYNWFMGRYGDLRVIITASAT